MNALANRMKQLVAKGKVHVALKQLQNIDAFDNQLQTQIETLNSRYHQLQTQIINGIISQDEINLENNRITNALLLLIDRFPDGSTLLEYKLSNLAKSLDISVEQVQTVMKALEERYQSRLYQKMDNYLSLSLQLSYTQEGTDQQFVETFFDEESKGTDFIQKNCLDVLKQHQHLLILGNPGAGKTTLLLQLAINLLQQYEELQIPIIFNLASWTKKEPSFKQWLQNVLENGYGFSKEFAAKSLAQNAILPLLDGFDEVGKAYKDEAVQNELRQHCLEAIGQYITNENVQQFIICSRRKEYQAAPQNAPIRAEILINPLSIQQIETALTRQKSSGLTNKERTLIDKIKVLQEQNHPLLEVLCTSFYFNLIFDTEEFTHSLNDIDKLPQKKVDIEQYLLSTFIDKKLNSIIYYPKNKTTQYLTWLAYWMNRRDSVSFELADLQPGILKRRWLFGLVFGLILGIVYGLTYGLFAILIESLNEDLVSGLVGVLIQSLGFSLVVGLVIVLNKNSKIQTEDIRQSNWTNLMHPHIWISIIKQIIKRVLQLCLLFCLVFALTFILIFLVEGLLSGLDLDLIEDLVGALAIGLLYGLVFGLISGLILGLVESISRAAATIFFFNMIKMPYARLKSGWQIYIFQSLIIGALTLIPSVFYLYLVKDLFRDILFILPITISFLLLPAILLFLVKMPLIRHFILRIALTLEKKVPLKYVNFLNAATKARILERDGGHWRFRHQLIQDYFAKLYQKY